MRDFHENGRSPVYAANGMAATSMPIASLAAIEILRAGGNAVDAAVAACAVLAVVEPQSTGLGGDCFCLYAPADGGKVVAVNGSGRSAAAASIEAIEAAGPAARDHTSPHAVTIPGAVSGWQLLLDTHGTRGFDELLQPAIRCAEEGFPVHSRVTWDWSLQVEKLRRAGNKLFLPGGRAPVDGELFVQTALGGTLRAIAARGADAFYSGPVAADMTATLRAAGGVQTEEDFANGRASAEFVEPIHLNWRGLDVWQCPPNGPGIVALMILGQLEALGTAPDGPDGATRHHRHIEAARLAYRDRDAFLADPLLRETPVSRLLSPAYLAALARLIDDERSLPALPAPGESALDANGDTVTLSVVDRDGNACSLINSIYQTMGSGILAERSGVLMQNRGLCFSFERGHPNSLSPNARPAHTIMPGMATRDGRPAMCFGVMGEHYQPMGQTWLLTNALEYGMDIQQALDFPRVCPYMGEVETERRVSPALRERLSALGHKLTEVERPLGGGQAIGIDRDRGVLVGGSDPRKDGAALGY
ncbi:MAG TPA: gamma-glutamyltransferase family protein [Roseiarcus sp.]